MPTTQFAFTGNKSPTLRHIQQTADAIKTNSFLVGNVQAFPSCFCPKTGIAVGNGA
jgi:hypothetical protein